VPDSSRAGDGCDGHHHQDEGERPPDRLQCETDQRTDHGELNQGAQSCRDDALVVPQRSQPRSHDSDGDQ
jgi:hypothetical protein